MRKFGSYILGAAIGGLIGSALALLFAPVSGGLVRERIRNATSNIQNDVKSAAEQKSLELRQQLEALQKK
ncbi:MAG: YtxH domain-containing protein [Anaerolineaceae bacterium]|nr:YtxH domain-containing protein [Anaerolineaceae bacterium]